jgi:hypothetical protein
MCLAAGGCGDGQRPQSESERNLQALAVMYGRFISQNRGMGPPNEAEFKKYIRSRPSTDLESFKIDPAAVDQIFISPRDQQPYGIAWGIRPGAPGPDGMMPMIIWEQTGEGGKRYVADSLGKIEEIDDTTFQARLAAVPKGK